MNPSSPSGALTSVPCQDRPCHWFLDAVSIIWASFGLASLGLALIGATALTGTPLSLIYDQDAYLGVVAVPHILGFACFGAFIGGCLGSRRIRAAACFGPLVVLASFLWLADRFGDLGEGEQVATLYANGLFIGGLSILPAFLLEGPASRMVMRTVPHAVAGAIGVYFIVTFGV